MQRALSVVAVSLWVALSAQGQGAVPKLADSFEKFAEHRMSYVTGILRDRPLDDPVAKKTFGALLDAEPETIVAAATRVAAQWTSVVVQLVDQRSESECLAAPFSKHFGAADAAGRAAVIPTLIEHLSRVRDHEHGVQSGSVTLEYGGVFCGSADGGYTAKTSSTTGQIGQSSGRPSPSQSTLVPSAKSQLSGVPFALQSKAAPVPMSQKSRTPLPSQSESGSPAAS